MWLWWDLQTQSIDRKVSDEQLSRYNLRSQRYDDVDSLIPSRAYLGWANKIPVLIIKIETEVKIDISYPDLFECNTLGHDQRYIGHRPYHSLLCSANSTFECYGWFDDLDVPTCSITTRSDVSSGKLAVIPSTIDLSDFMPHTIYFQ